MSRSSGRRGQAEPLAALAAVFAVGLERGLDRAVLGYRCGRALLSATAIYLGAVAAARVLL